MVAEVVFKYRDTKIKMDVIWLAFFVMIFCFYTNSYAQYVSHALIIMYCIYIRLKRNGVLISRLSLKKFIVASGSYCALVLWAQLSKQWAYDVMEDTKTFVGMVKILVVIICMVLYVGSKEKLNSVLASFVFAIVIMSVLILTTSPISTFGTTSFGGITHQFRNTIANTTFFAVIIIWYFKNNFTRAVRNLLMVILLGTGLCTGSRRGIIQLVIIVCLFIITQSNLKKKLYLLAGSIIVMIIAIGLMNSVPYLRETYWTRMSTMFNSSTEIDDDTDASTVGRNIYRKIGLDMFYMRPIHGFGIDGFHCYLEDRPYDYTESRLEAVYSHCNYVELLADFGLVGFVLYYIMHMYILINSLKMYKTSKFARMSLIIIIATLILDYGGMSYQSTFAIYLYAIMLLGIFFEKQPGKKEKQKHYNQVVLNG